MIVIISSITGVICFLLGFVISSMLSISSDEDEYRSGYYHGRIEGYWLGFQDTAHWCGGEIDED